MAKVDINLGGYYELFFIISYVCNLYINVGGYFELSIVMAVVGNILINYNKSNC
jgi:hypothetical protein